MISGAHVIVFSRDAEADRAFMRDALGFDSVDAGGGWLIFALPPAEIAVHPADAASHQLYLMCEDIDSTIHALREKGVRVKLPIVEQRWGRTVYIELPSGTELGLYEPKHPLPPRR